MKTWQKVGLGLLVLAIPVFLGAYSLGMFKLFAPATENIRRDVFENTKSYLHGVQADLGKYHEEYSKADADGRETIRQTIKLRFPSVDAEKLQNPALRAFLVNMRGF
jgi:hypothetical protein